MKLQTLALWVLGAAVLGMWSFHAIDKADTKKKNDQVFAVIAAERDMLEFDRDNEKVLRTTAEGNLELARNALAIGVETQSKLNRLNASLKDQINAIPKPKTCADFGAMLNAQRDAVIRVRNNTEQIIGEAGSGEGPDRGTGQP